MSNDGPANWCDITTEDAQSLAEFYQLVMGWKIEPVDMGDYQDYVMMTADGQPVGGICHARGSNASMPAGWIQYFTVKDLSASLAQAVGNGGRRIGEIRHHGAAEYCVIQDPSGACCALYAPNDGS